MNAEYLISLENRWIWSRGIAFLVIFWVLYGLFFSIWSILANYAAISINSLIGAFTMLIMVNINLIIYLFIFCYQVRSIYDQLLPHYMFVTSLGFVLYGLLILFSNQSRVFDFNMVIPYLCIMFGMIFIHRADKFYKYSNTEAFRQKSVQRSNLWICYPYISLFFFACASILVRLFQLG